ncbi:MAG: FeMo cofactor biosynthesis protein nifB, partial [Methanomicrobiales archaeon 53_19]
MVDESYRTATVQGREVPYDPEQMRKVNEHPCYSEKACHAFGRCHLPVAPKCNIQCNYCIRDFDCVNESRPGVTSKVLTPEEGLDLVRKVVKDYPFVKVIGIAGPGEPLANPETFEALRLVHEEFPHLIMCLSTNGLMLPESIEELAKYNVGNITVTLNAVDPAIGEKIYSWVEYNGKKYHGREAAELLLSRQLKGIEMAVAKKTFVKINTVYIPGVNDE